ncbi:tyrosine-type recombinase/integrase [Streptosporangium lutulentum]|uniref:tyrosine-type recombinase/integrase n=1 Tax=Streptosporangium lutulentum TaxID=1461250 RepID=UPI003520D428
MERGTVPWCRKAKEGSTAGNSPLGTAARSSAPRTGRCGKRSSSDPESGTSGCTAATLLIEQRVNIRVVQEVLGHTRVTTTERYTHTSTPLMRDAGERPASALWGKS